MTPQRIRQKLIQQSRHSDPHGYDAGEKIKRKKRHFLVDNQGLLRREVVHAADVRDSDGGVMVIASLLGLYSFLLRLYADGRYASAKFQVGLVRTCRHVEVETVKRSGAATGTFVVVPRHWIVKRTNAWLSRCRRLAKNWKCLNRNALPFLQ